MIAAGADEAALIATLGPLPLAALRLDEEAIARFAQAGLRRIDDLLLRPRAPIAARFGRDIHQRLDALLGRARAPISPCFEAPAFVAERRFAEGIARREGIEATILALCHDLCGLLARHGEGARRLDVTLFRVDGAVRHIEVGTSRPLREPETMARLFRERIETIGEDGLDTGYGFDVIRLAALAAERLDEGQADWSGATSAEADLADLIDRLGARFGLDRVTRLAPEDSHIPEQAARERPARALDAVAAAAAASKAGGSKAGGSKATASGERRLEARRARGPRPPRGEGPPPSARRHAATAREAALTLSSETLSSDTASSDTASPVPWFPDDAPSLPARPIRLLRRPEPIDTIASVPDGPPLRFRWRQVTHQVAAIEGPERIGPEWWKGAAPTRDYFRAEDTAGQRFWLFREGLYQDTPAPRWFMHGLFA
jgi:protein ImuB